MSKNRLRLGAAIALGLLVVCVIAVFPTFAQDTATEEPATEAVEATPAAIAVAEDEVEETLEPITVDNLDIPVEELKLLVKPLTQEQLQAEALGWFGILEEKAQDIAETEVAIAQDSGESKTELIDQVTELQGEQTAIIDRFNVILDSLERKGGDPEVFRQYISAVTSLDLNVTDTQGLSTRLIEWLKSEEGGIRWGLSILQFVIILAVSAVAARALAKVAETALTPIEAISNLFRGFLVKTVKRAVLVIGFLVALTSLGVSLGSLLAVFGGLSFILAFSLQSNLGNFASGLMLLVYKPFDVGDKVLIPGTNDKGFVRSISLANTSFDHYTGKIVTIPNSAVWGARIENLLPGDDRLIEFLFTLSSNDDARIIKASWDKAIENHPGILKDKWHMSVPFISPIEWSINVLVWCLGTPERILVSV